MMIRQKLKLSERNSSEGEVLLLSEPTDISHELANLSAPAIRVLTLDDIAELRRHENHLDDLAKYAVEPNVFLEPWMFFPALESFGLRKPIIFLLFFMDT